MPEAAMAEPRTAPEVRTAGKTFKVVSNGRVKEILILDAEPVRQDVLMKQIKDETVQVPKGWNSLLTVETGRAAWRHNAEFNQNLQKNVGVWTGQVGQTANGPKKIEQDCKTTTITENAFGELRDHPEQREWDYKGKGLVALDGDGDDGYDGDGCLGVYADYGADLRLRVAFERDLGEAEAPKSGTVSVELRRKAQEELDALSRVVKPELVEALTKLVREA